MAPLAPNRERGAPPGGAPCICGRRRLAAGAINDPAPAQEMLTFPARPSPPQAAAHRRATADARCATQIDYDYTNERVGRRQRQLYFGNSTLTGRSTRR